MRRHQRESGALSIDWYLNSWADVARAWGFRVCTPRVGASHTLTIIYALTALKVALGTGRGALFIVRGALCSGHGAHSGDEKQGASALLHQPERRPCSVLTSGC